jgi:hypothetical protein
VIIDQGHKLVSAVNDIVATDGGAFAGIWKHMREEAGYQAREEHLKRHNHLYVLRNNWAQFVYEGIDRPHWAVLADIFVKALGEQSVLGSIFALNESLHWNSRARNR